VTLTQAVPLAMLLMGPGGPTRGLAAQTPVLELDHVYVVVTPPAASAAQALERAGLVVDSEVTRHEGEGTASIAAFFDNAYLEIIWVDSSVPVDSAHRLEVADFRRAAAWPQSGASPFGLGLHFLSGTAADLPVPARADPAPHLGPGIAYLLLRQPTESLAVDLFVMPPGRPATSWLGRYRSRRPDLFAHPMGAHSITRIVVHGRSANRPRAADLDLRPIHFAPAGAPYLVVEFDDGKEGRSWDLRPALPLVLRR
jgi:hypothetical protein